MSKVCSSRAAAQAAPAFVHYAITCLSATSALNLVPLMWFRLAGLSSLWHPLRTTGSTCFCVSRTQGALCATFILSCYASLLWQDSAHFRNEQRKQEAVNAKIARLKVG
jgi:hypothetical protein